VYFLRSVVTLIGMPTQGSPGRGRGRPRGRSAVTRDSIVATPLRLAGDEGFGEVTMHRLARELGVTPRALYNHVADRQEVIDLVAAELLRQLPEHAFDQEDWRGTLRAAYAEAREVYRRHPRATLISLDETVTATSIDPRRLTSAERMLEFFVGIGLSLEQAVDARTAFLLDVFAFSILVDYRYDRSPEPVRAELERPVPTAWLDTLPEVEAPNARAASGLPGRSSEGMFEAFVEMRIAGVEQMLGATRRPPASSDAPG
jgi:AcrR family transcriptional regulator